MVVEEEVEEGEEDELLVEDGNVMVYVLVELVVVCVLVLTQDPGGVVEEVEEVEEEVEGVLGLEELHTEP